MTNSSRCTPTTRSTRTRAPRRKQGSEAPRRLVEEGREIEKAFAELEKARTQISVEAEQKMAAFRLGILDRFHADGLLSEQDYWDARATVQSSAYQAGATR